MSDDLMARLQISLHQEPTVRAPRGITVYATGYSWRCDCGATGERTALEAAAEEDGIEHLMRAHHPPLDVGLLTVESRLAQKQKDRTPMSSDEGEERPEDAARRFARRLEAVTSLHAERWRDLEGSTLVWCRECGQNWPCPTIRAATTDGDGTAK